MKGSLSVPFANPAQAKKALAALKPLNYDERADVRVRVDRNELVVDVSAKDFTPLRSTITSLLRDVKVIRDSFSVAGGTNGHE